MNDTLNIALLSLHSCPWAKPGSRYTGGMNVYIKEIVKQLGQKGHSIDIYTTANSCCDQKEVVDLGNRTQLIHLQADEYGNITENNLNLYVNNILESIYRYQARTGRHYDLISSHYWLSGMVGLQLQKSWDIPHITMFHTLGAIKNNLGLGILEPDFRILNEQLIMDCCNRIVTLSEKDKQELLNHYIVENEKVATIPCGINLEQFHPRDKQLARKVCGLNSKKVALYVGRIDPLKGLDSLLKAVSMLKDRNDFELVVIGGDGKAKYELTMLKDMKKRDMQGKVDFRGSVAHEEIHHYYNAADFCVIPSHYESASLVALEALACGTPIIAADVGGIKDLARKCPICRLAEDNTPANLAIHITHMLNSNELRPENFPDQCPCLTEYSWNNVADKLISEYQDVVSTFSPEAR
ncbi:MAG: glycosyltransferase [Dehalococcoidia bacterium]|nr:glycosyltransferase [Dehalococcoidia bacterium]MDD5493364.1 glycosyltransferase [Dehalococcoidia bacterium]